MVQHKWYQSSRDMGKGRCSKLNEMNIMWNRPKCIHYVKENKVKRYTPDFYLPDFDIYLEVKGFWWGKDKEKMELVISQHKDKTFIVVQKEEFRQIMQGELVW